MQLQSLSITLDNYGEHKGNYIGSAHFAGQYGGVQIVIHPDVSGEILKLVAEQLVRASKELANRLTADTMTQAFPILEKK